ncbi:adenylyl-sulfate kinase [Kribbella sp. NPDC023972]|uniref:adenylyl-sulfate kinase n=1 Tax=Kribbella sp. NPDC023972 TaxID=3154795 RepID=UPI0033FF1B36
MPQALLLTGGDGVGKTTIAQAIGRLLTSGRHPTGLLDLDAISQFGPAQPASGLRFHDRLRVRNLAAVWTTYREAGAQFMVVSGHVESPELRAAYTESLAECDVQLVRLFTPADVIAERTRTTRGPEWDLATALAQAATHQPIQDFTVTNDRTPEEVAADILVTAGWPA